MRELERFIFLWRNLRRATFSLRSSIFQLHIVNDNIDSNIENLLVCSSFKTGRLKKFLLVISLRQYLRLISKAPPKESWPLTKVNITVRNNRPACTSKTAIGPMNLSPSNGRRITRKQDYPPSGSSKFRCNSIPIANGPRCSFASSRSD